MHKKLIIFDMDGTIYLGKDLFDGRFQLFESLACDAVGEKTSGKFVRERVCPAAVLRRVCKRCLIEEQQGRLSGRELFEFGVARAVGNTRVEDLDDKIHVFEVFRDQATGLRHVPREPLNDVTWQVSSPRFL